MRQGVRGIAASGVALVLLLAPHRASAVEVGFDGGLEYLKQRHHSSWALSTPFGLLSPLPVLRFTRETSPTGQIETAVALDVVRADGDTDLQTLLGVSHLFIARAHGTSLRRYVRVGGLLRVTEHGATLGAQVGAGVVRPLSDHANTRFELLYARPGSGLRVLALRAGLSMRVP